LKSTDITELLSIPHKDIMECLKSFRSERNIVHFLGNHIVPTYDTNVNGDRYEAYRSLPISYSFFIYTSYIMTNPINLCCIDKYAIETTPNQRLTTLKFLPLDW